MNMRKITSLTALLSFIFIILTSFILYITPQGKIAYWSDWQLWGLSKVQWGDIHINTGILFLLALGLHTYYNWKPITSYLKNSAKKMTIFTKEFNIAGIIVLLFVFGTFFNVPPFSSILDFNADLKTASAKKYGEPPYGHAEVSSLKTFAKKTGLDLEQSISALKKAGIEVSSEKQTLLELSREYNMAPIEIHLAMKAGQSKKQTASNDKLPPSPPPGTGNMTLKEVCSNFNLNMKTIMQKLSISGISAKGDMTIKQIAKAHKTGPMDIYESIKEIANKL
jgi:hypothetical protein